MTFSRLSRVALVLPAAMMALALLASPALASTVAQKQDQPVRLSVKPVDQPGAFFDLTLNPGEARDLSINLGNHGVAPVAARTYAADVQTIVNGGFGPNLRDKPATGATTWLDYETSVLDLPAGEAITRSFTVRVPPDTAAGEYITSLVLENDEAVKGSGPLAVDQVVRQAVAVAIRVPGQLTPALKIGGARHTLVADRSVVAIGVSNPGNARLKPTGRMVLKDQSGQMVSRASVSMDSFYSHTETLIEFTLEQMLRPGPYTVDVTLEDSQRHASAAATGLLLTVEAPKDTADEVSPGSQVIDVLQSQPAGVPVWAIALATLLILAAVVRIIRHAGEGRGRRASGRRAASRRNAGRHV